MNVEFLSGLIILFEVLTIVIALIIQGLIAYMFSKCAAEKGYSIVKYFFVCFFLGLAGCCLVAALPDKVLNSKMDGIVSRWQHT